MRNMYDNANALLESKLTKLLATVGLLTHYCTLIPLYSVSLSNI